MKALKKEIDAILSNKLRDAVEAYQVQRNQNFEELAALRKAVEDLEAETENIQKEMGGLNTRRASDLGEYNRLTRKLSRFPKVFKAKRARIGEIMTKLTEIDIDPKTLNLILTYRGKGGSENEKG